jgi:hypothetical protein
LLNGFLRKRDKFMPTLLEWDNPEKTAFRIELNDKWTWAEFDTAIDESNRSIAAHPAKVDVILCINAALPPGNALTHLRRAGNQPPNAHRTVMVQGASLFLESLVRTVDKAKKWEGPAFVKTLEEARELLKDNN